MVDKIVSVKYFSVPFPSQMTSSLNDLLCGSFLVVLLLSALSLSSADMCCLMVEDPLEREMAAHNLSVHRQRSLAGCSPWVGKESDTTE